MEASLSFDDWWLSQKDLIASVVHPDDRILIKQVARNAYKEGWNAKNDEIAKDGLVSETYAPSV